MGKMIQLYIAAAAGWDFLLTSFPGGYKTNIDTRLRRDIFVEGYGDVTIA